MTSRQRVEAALAHREPDRTPVFEYVLQSPVADAMLGRPYAADEARWREVAASMPRPRAVERRAADQPDLALKLGHDMMYVVPAHRPAPVAPARDESRMDDLFDGDPVQLLRQRNRRAADAASPPPEEPFEIYPCLQRLMRERDVDLPILAPAYAHGIWTDTVLMQTMLLAPDVAREHFQLATQRATGLIDRYLELGIDQIGVGGDFAGTRPLISPELYRRFIMPEVRALSRRVHAGGARAINASDGDLWPVIDDFLLGCEVDGYLEIDLQAGMDLPGLKRRFGGRVALYGNLDCGNTLSFASPEQVRRHTTDCLDAGRGAGGHILCASNAITAAIPLANYLAVVNAYRAYFDLPRFAS